MVKKLSKVLNKFFFLILIIVLLVSSNDTFAIAFGQSYFKGSPGYLFKGPKLSDVKGYANNDKEKSLKGLSGSLGFGYMINENIGGEIFVEYSQSSSKVSDYKQQTEIYSLRNRYLIQQNIGGGAKAVFALPIANNFNISTGAGVGISLLSALYKDEEKRGSGSDFVLNTQKTKITPIIFYIFSLGVETIMGDGIATGLEYNLKVNKDKELQRRGSIGLIATTSGKYNHNLVATVKFVF